MTTIERNIAHYERLLQGSLSERQRSIARFWLWYWKGVNGKAVAP